MAWSFGMMRLGRGLMIQVRQQQRRKMAPLRALSGLPLRSAGLVSACAVLSSLRCGRSSGHECLRTSKCKQTGIPCHRCWLVAVSPHSPLLEAEAESIPHPIAPRTTDMTKCPAFLTT